MIKSKRSLSLLLLSLFGLVTFCSQSVIAQSPSAKTTLIFINEKLAPKCKLELVHGKFTAVYHDEKGKKVREDEVNSLDLDIDKSGYEPSDQVFYIPCLPIANDCVYRKLYLSGNYRYYPRASFIVTNEESANNLKIALRHLINLSNYSNYKDTVNFH